MTTGKTIALTGWTFVSKVVFLVFNLLPRLVIAFLPRSKHLLLSWRSSPSAVMLEPPKNKVSHCFHCFSHYLPWNDLTGAMIFVFWRLSLKPAFSGSSFSFIKRLLSSFWLSALRVVSSVYLRFWIFLPEIMIPICASSIPVCPNMYRAYTLNEQADNVQPWRTPFPIWNQSVVTCPVLTVACWHA